MNTIQIGILCTGLLLLGTGCRQNSSPVAPDPNYAVYSAIIDSDCPTTQSGQQAFLIINPKTAKPGISDWNSLIQQINQPSISNDPAWQQFILSIDSTAFNTNPLTGSVPSTCFRTQVLTDEQWMHYFGTPTNPGIEGLRNDFSGFSSYLTFSSVVYSADQTKAICYRASVCGGLCGSGNLFFLERKSATWTVVGSVLLWIS
ncbi:hypothetical protein WBJ53_07980 [Spirosoma sp. SC4-14]|uniref:hypothetical protein n=1 Tax=Spirosoma sp. SC4-14 TaxID=3128900 RepID=UPI0030D60551